MPANYPEDWQIKRLGEIFPKIVVGYVGNVNKYYCDKGRGIPFYRTLNIRDGHFRHDGIRYVSHDFHKKNKKSQIANNDILIARVGANLGMVCKVDGLTNTANIANAIVIKGNDSADSDFFSFFLVSKQGKSQILSAAAGGAQGVFNTKLAQDIIVPSPPLSEQTKIAQILSTWDKAIDTVERLIENSKAQKKALMRPLLDGSRRFPEYGQEWRTSKLGDLFDIRIGGTPSRGRLEYWDTERTTHNRWLAISDLTSKYIGDSKEYVSDLGIQNSNVKPIPENTVVMSFKLTLGRAAILVNQCFTNEAICAFVPIRSDTVHPEFLYQAISGLNLDESVDQAVKGKTLNKAKLKEIVLRHPSFDEQKRIAAVLHAIDRECSTLEAQAELLRREKSALMQQLLTGKRRVAVTNQSREPVSA